jgi:predicted RNase H-like HicB family nuclease
LNRYDTTKSRFDKAEAFFMKTIPIVIERCPVTGLYVGSVPGLPGAHSQVETLGELRANMREVIDMLLEDGDPLLQIPSLI